MKRAVSTARGGFLEQLVYVLGVVEGGVEVEVQLGHYAQLGGHLAAEFAAYGLLVLLQDRQHALRLVGREDAEISCADAEVRRHATLGHAHHHAVHHSCLRLEDEAKLLLQQSRYSVLSCFLHICYCFIIVFLKPHPRYRNVDF